MIVYTYYAQRFVYDFVRDCGLQTYQVTTQN
jgi:hypothetical protein